MSAFSGSGVSRTSARISRVRYGLLGSMMSSVAFGWATRFLYFCRTSVIDDLSSPSSSTMNHTAVDWGRPSLPTVVSVATFAASRRSAWDSGTFRAMGQLLRIERTRLSGGRRGRRAARPGGEHLAAAGGDRDVAPRPRDGTPATWDARGAGAGTGRSRPWAGARGGRTAARTRRPS